MDATPVCRLWKISQTSDSAAWCSESQARHWSSVLTSRVFIVSPGRPRSPGPRTPLACWGTRSPRRSLPRLIQAVAFQDERPHLVPVLHAGDVHADAALLPRVRLEPGVRCEETARMLRLELEHEAAHALLLAAGGEHPPA